MAKEMTTKNNTRFGCMQWLCDVVTRPRGPLATLLMILSVFPGVIEACPGCKEALFDPGQLQQKLATARGYAWSIALMLAVPVALVGGVTTLVVRAARRRRPLDAGPGLPRQGSGRLRQAGEGP